MERLKNKMNQMEQVAMMKLHQAKQKVLGVFAQNSGEGFIDTALKILISVVVGSLLLAGLYMLFKGSLLPELQKRIMSIFDFKG